jgi:hypothetical protein
VSQTIEQIKPVIHRMIPNGMKLTDAQASDIARVALDSVSALTGDDRACQLALAIRSLKQRI